ncbi:ArnT family glycosyltransferase [Sinosporangium siamense]|uniref:Glycosyl transferase n=1 Tax=Sinosporangium siamense TaxID=1367973 RepID=A0A919RKV1_9ACTN|nr:glycosyltransferase family 39 protein [Sinosporangium siamense]GII95067.1 glycosyl transferase [Sinosporangium siamense]
MSATMDTSAALALPPPETPEESRKGHRLHTVAVAAMTVLAAVTYLWGIERRPSGIQAYYAAAVRTMSESWSAFWWGGFDPAGFLSVDKVPGGLWPQALSVRLFGYSDMAQLLPQALVMAGCVPLLYAAVRRWAGPAAGLAGAAVLVTTPVWTVIARINAPDVYLMFCLLAVVYCATRGLKEGRAGSMAWAGLWLALGFQAKMLQAVILWGVVAAVYLCCAPPPWRRRTLHVAASSALALAVSLFWPLTAALMPAAARPYMDGSAGDSVWEMLFLYNGLSRVLDAGQEGLGPAPLTAGGAAGPLRLLGPEHAAQIGWLLPAALISLAVALLSARRAPRTDLLRSGWLLWGGWLLAYGLATSFAEGVHPYYTSSFAPAVAALAGAGAVAAARLWNGPWPGPVLLPLLIVVTTVWAVVILGDVPYAPPWSATAVAAAGGVALFLLVVSKISEFGGRPVGLLGAGVAAAGALLGPAVWSAATLDRPTSTVGAFFAMIEPVAGPSDYEAKAAAMLKVRRPLRAEELKAAEAALISAIPHADQGLHNYLRRRQGQARYLMATTGAELAAPYIARFGSAVLPMGGFTGGGPRPSAQELASLVEQGQVRYVLTGGYGVQNRANRDRTSWVHTSCRPVAPSAYGARRVQRAPVLYDCKESHELGR